jgi:predicted kinase
MIFLMRSTTCGGKDTFIKQHFTDESAIFSSDDFRKMLCGDIHVQQFNKNVFDLMHFIIDFRLANRVDYTVYNATNLRMRDSSHIFELSKKHHTPITIIAIKPPALEMLHIRNKKRFAATGVLIPDGVIDKHYHRYEHCEKPFTDEAMNNVLVKFIEIDQDYEVIREI